MITVDFDPIALSLGPLTVRWYGILYVLGILLAWKMAHRLIRQEPLGLTPTLLGDFILWAVVGIVLGGRLGFVLFYSPLHFLHHPLEIFMTWQGGMSFHGGCLGVIMALYAFCRVRNIPFLLFLDLVALVVPLGIALGRVGNFINGEHWGRPTEVPWAMIFPYADATPRHPSQLYEALLEGLLLFGVLIISNRRWTLRRCYPGFCAGLFGLLYALNRSIAEVFRDPDGYWGWLTMGQAYSLPLAFMGIVLMVYGVKKAQHRPGKGLRVSRGSGVKTGGASESSTRLSGS